MEAFSKVDNLLGLKEICERDVEDDIIIFLTVYYSQLPPLAYVKVFMKISKKRYDIFKNILWVFLCKSEVDVK